MAMDDPLLFRPERPGPKMDLTLASMDSEAAEDYSVRPKSHGGLGGTSHGGRPNLFLNFSGTLSSLNTSRSDFVLSKPGTPLPERNNFRTITGKVDVIIFDFDGTLTATPGDRQVRKEKRVEIEQRAPLLKPALSALREAGALLGILSKSTEVTIRDALAAGGLTSFFDAPIIGKAVGFEGKAGYIRDLAQQGSLRRPGDRRPGPVAHRILLVDDDVLELERARAAGLQTYAAPTDGGLQEEDFGVILESLKLPPNRPPRATSRGSLGTLNRISTTSVPALSPPVETQPWCLPGLDKPTQSGRWRNLILFSGDCFEG